MKTLVKTTAYQQRAKTVCIRRQWYNPAMSTIIRLLSFQCHERGQNHKDVFTLFIRTMSKLDCSLRSTIYIYRNPCSRMLISNQDALDGHNTRSDTMSRNGYIVIEKKITKTTVSGNRNIKAIEIEISAPLKPVKKRLHIR